MPDDIHEPRVPVNHPDARYEESDVNFRWIAAILIVATALTAITLYVIWVFFVDFRQYQSRIKESPFPLAPGPSTSLPAKPRLEQVERQAGIGEENAGVMKSSKEETLSSYGPTRDKDYVHIPIDEAMKQLANKLPVRKPPSAAEARREGGLVDAGESNSGRIFRKK